MQVTPKENYADRATPSVENKNDSGKITDTAASEREIPYSEKDTKYVDISPDITSRFMFYNYNTLSIKPFSLGCLRKIFRAVNTQRISYMAEVISHSIDPDKSALDLTTQDFWSLMIWERINSYKKSPYRVSFECTEPKHLEKIAAGEWPAESVKNSILIKNASAQLQIKQIDPEAVTAYVQRVRAEYNVGLYPQRVSDVVELEDLREVLKEDDDIEELEWIAKLASNISKEHGIKLEDRIKFLTENEDLSADLYAEIEKFIELADHGVNEKAKVTCTGCGAVKEVDLSFNALTFFPSDN